MASQQNKDSGYVSFLSPSKLINLQRQSNGFGFTLRHFVVYPPELIRKSSEVSFFVSSKQQMGSTKEILLASE